VRALLSVLMLASCSTASSPRKPEFVTAQCPKSEVRIDRSFATAEPPCLNTLTALTASKGDGNLEVQTNLAGEVKTRDICIAEVRAWVKSERAARATGAPGA